MQEDLVTRWISLIESHCGTGITRSARQQAEADSANPASHEGVTTAAEAHQRMPIKCTSSYSKPPIGYMQSQVQGNARVSDDGTMKWNSSDVGARHESSLYRELCKMSDADAKELLGEAELGSDSTHILDSEVSEGSNGESSEARLIVQ